MEFVVWVCALCNTSNTWPWSIHTRLVLLIVGVGLGEHGGTRGHGDGGSARGRGGCEAGSRGV
jgi:hypothetical protein